MDRAHQDLPGVVVIGKTGEERIQELRDAGQNTAWYDRGAGARLGAPMEADKACSWFTVYLLEGECAWTKNQDGSKYLQYRKLKQAVYESVYYCASCKQRWTEYAEAVGHVGVNQ